MSVKVHHRGHTLTIEVLTQFTAGTYLFVSIPLKPHHIFVQVFKTVFLLQFSDKYSMSFYWHYPENKGSNLFRNFGTYIPIYTSSCSKSRDYSIALMTEFQIWYL
jgi:hypothetical protein